jgi:uncharacterized protein YceK
MRGFALACLLVSAAALAAGCGTVANMNGGALMGFPREGYPKPYCGVAVLAEGAVENGQRLTSEPLWSGTRYLVLLADLPLTLVGDTVTLPWVLAQRGAGAADVRPRVLAVTPVEGREPEPLPPRQGADGR